MGVILAKFRKEKSTQQVLEALQEKIYTLETFTIDTQEQKKRIVGNFLAVSIGVYVIAFAIFYFVYFPTSWKERIIYFTPLLLFPIIIILLRYLFTWYFQRKLNKNSKKLAALRAEKKKILEQVMDKETYKVAVNLLARFADKPSKTSFALSTTTPSKMNQPLLNRTRLEPNSNQKTNQMTLTSTPSTQTISNYLMPNTPRPNFQISSPSPTTALISHTNDANQQLRRRTPFPIVNQNNKGVFDRIVDVLIGDGPKDRFAMICKECYSHNGMALKEDFEYTTFKCAFCDALNPSRKTRPVAPRLSVLSATNIEATGTDSSDSDEEDSEDDRSINLNVNIKQEYSTPRTSSNLDEKSENENTPAKSSLSFPSISAEDEEDVEAKLQLENTELDEKSKKAVEAEEDSSLDNILKHLEKSDSAIEDLTVSPE